MRRVNAALLLIIIFIVSSAVFSSPEAMEVYCLGRIDAIDPWC
jgi:hypothetical protein